MLGKLIKLKCYILKPKSLIEKQKFMFQSLSFATGETEIRFCEGFNS